MASKRSLEERINEKNEMMEKALEKARQYEAQVKQLEKQQKEALFDLSGRLLNKQFLIPGCFFKSGQDREDRDREQN